MPIGMRKPQDVHETLIDAFNRGDVDTLVGLYEPGARLYVNEQQNAVGHVAMERDSVRLSLENLMTFPFVAERVAAGTLSLHGARFGIADGKLEILDTTRDEFVSVE